MFIDHFDGKSVRRRSVKWLQAAIANVNVRVADCERLRSDAHLAMWRNIGARGKARIGQGFLAFLSALAEDERERIVKRAADGRKLARKKGVRLGRKPKLTEHQIANARTELARGRSCRDVGRDLNVHHSTISRIR